MTDSEKAEMAAFEDAIKADRYDLASRLVYADWLEERGLDDRAARERLWTEEWQKAEDWLRDFAEQCGDHRPNYPDDDGWRDITLEDVVQGGIDWVATAEKHGNWWHGDCFVQLGNDKARNLFQLVKKLYWRHFQTYTRTEVPEEKQGEPFSCSC